MDSGWCRDGCIRSTDKTCDFLIVRILSVFNSVTVVLTEAIIYGSDKKTFERFVPLMSVNRSVRDSDISLIFASIAPTI